MIFDELLKLIASLIENPAQKNGAQEAAPSGADARRPSGGRSDISRPAAGGGGIEPIREEAGYALKDFIYETQQGEARIVQYTGRGGTVIIPSRTPDGTPVRVIGRNAFGHNGSLLRAVIIPESVETIENSAFSWCRNLSEVTLPESLRHIGSSAFCSCSALKTVVIPDGVYDMDEWAFAQCDDLIRVKMPESLSHISDFLFANCGRLHDLILPEGITSIGKGAFQCCQSLESVFHLPDGLTAVGYGAFSGCGKLEIVLPNSLREVNARDYQGVRGIQVRADHPTLTSIDGVLFSKDLNTLILYPNKEEPGYTVPDGVRMIGKGAFRENTALTRVSFPDSLEHIGNNAFDRCTGLTEIVIPEGIRSIGSYAFSGCTALKSVRLPESLAEIGYSCFQHCYQTVFTVPEHSYALSVCRNTGWYYRYPGSDRVLPSKEEDPEAYVKTVVHFLNEYLRTAVRPFCRRNHAWYPCIFSYDPAEDDIGIRDPSLRNRIGEYLRCLTRDPAAAEPLRIMKGYIIAGLRNIGAEIHEFTPEGERRFQEKYKEAICREDAFLFTAQGLWFVMELQWSD